MHYIRYLHSKRADLTKLQTKRLSNPIESNKPLVSTTNKVANIDRCAFNGQTMT